MKKTLYIPYRILAVPLLSDSVSADEVSRETAPMNLADILVSALYFIGVLALIYMILTLVSKWGKKHPDKKSEDQGNRKTSDINTDAREDEEPAAVKENKDE